VSNPHHDAIFNLFQTKDSPHTQTIQQKVASNNLTLPAHTNGCPMCLAFHVKGMCNTKCTHAHNHTMQNVTESQALLAWCKQHWK